MERSYENYLGHKKIIGYKKGRPIYSLTQPPVLSKPNIYMFSKGIFGLIQKRSFPVFMGFAVTDKCNANCEHCLFYTSVDDASRKNLTTDECKKIIFEAQELGVIVFNFVGGEPLLRDDIFEILKSIDKQRSIALMFTNGWLLADKVRDLKKADLDAVFVSIDSSKPEEHDRRRGKDGLFDRAITGIKEAKKAGLDVGICSSITEEDLNAGELEKIIELGKGLGVKEIIVFDTIPAGKLKNREDLVDHHDWIEGMVDVAKKYNSDPDYPGIFIYHYVMGYRGVGCISGSLYMYLNPYGDIYPCDFNHKSFGNVLSEPLYKIYDRMSTTPDLCQAEWGMCRMKNSDFREKMENNSSCESCGKCGK